ncbi:hypothetical protein [Actinosynnema sp. NPDC020468]
MSHPLPVHGVEDGPGCRQPWVERPGSRWATVATVAVSSTVEGVR